jgi:hypothetical protein
MYGDDGPEDHNAIKVAAHELKSAISLLSVRPSNLCLPLMTLVYTMTCPTLEPPPPLLQWLTTTF